LKGPKKKLKKNSFEDLLATVQKRIYGWKAKIFFQVCRSTPIKAVVAALVSYTRNSYLLPKSVCKYLDNMFKSFCGVSKRRRKIIGKTSLNSLELVSLLQSLHKVQKLSV
jgi:hypothetical protein